MNTKPFSLGIQQFAKGNSLTWLPAQKKFCLTQDQVQQLEQDGLVVVQGLISAAEIQSLRQLLEPLFAQFKKLPKNFAYDLGDCSLANGEPRNPEIARCLLLEPRLHQTQYVRKVRAIARQLLGPEARLCFDHAILKPPYSHCPTFWHQDEAYEKPGGSRQRLNFWLPLQDVTLESGCLQFIPGSNKGQLLPHRAVVEGAHALTTDEVKIERTVACPVNAGDFTIHTGRTLHYAGPNSTGQPRLAWVLVFAVGGNSPRARLMHTVAPVLQFVMK